MSCLDMVSLQASFGMIVFLYSIGNISTWSAYVRIAARRSICMRLHISINEDMNPIERENRKRLFWAILKMDIFVGTLYGMPRTIPDDEIGQDLPIDADDVYITKSGVLPFPQGSVPNIAATNEHTRLLIIVSKISRYALDKEMATAALCGVDVQFTDKIARVVEIEHELQQWKARLRPEFRLSNNIDSSHHQRQAAYLSGKSVLQREG
jgi:hypothetical protein